MLIFLIIYVLGIIATLWLGYHNLDSGDEITVSELPVIVVLCAFSWAAFIVEIIAAYGDKTVFKKK